MAVQTFLVKCHEGTAAKKIKMLVDQIHAWGGRVLLITEGGLALVVAIDDRLREVVNARSEVNIIGGIQLQPRRIRRIRVDQSGKTLSSDVLIQGENHG